MMTSRGNDLLSGGKNDSVSVTVSIHVTLTVTLTRLLVLRPFPQIFKVKKYCSQCSPVKALDHN